MPSFKYTATDREGKKVDGRMEAQDRAAVAARLQELSFFPLHVSREAEGEEEGLSLTLLSGGRGRFLVHFTGQLAVLS